jgi:hypothetical protein
MTGHYKIFMAWLCYAKDSGQVLLNLLLKLANSYMIMQEHGRKRAEQDGSSWYSKGTLTHSLTGFCPSCEHCGGRLILLTVIT